MEPSPPFNTAQIVFSLIAASIAGGVATLVINKIASWASGRTRAEVVEIHARSVKLGTEAQAISAQEVRDATTRIVELVQINSELHEELSETGRQRDEFEYNLKREQYDHEQLKTRHEIQSHFIAQLEAANKLGVQLKDITPELKLVEPDASFIRRASGTTGTDNLEDDSLG